jgi:hypothetical protein
MGRLLAAAALLTPATALGDMDDPFTVALQAQGVRHAPDSMRATSGDFGFGARLKFFRGFGFDASCTLSAANAPDPQNASTVKELFPQPNVRLLGVFEPLPNRYFSPYLLAGSGWATRASDYATTLLGGLGVQIGLGAHVAVALDVFMLFPWPVYATSFVRRNEEARMAGAEIEPVGISDLVDPGRHEAQLSLRYYL